MKCLSLKQPFSYLLASGEKTIELRKWNTFFRGEFLIHSSRTIDIDACERLDIDSNILTTGSIIGSAYFYDVKEYHTVQEFNKDKHKHFSIVSKYFEGYRYGFLIKNAKVFSQSIPYSGRLKFFNVDDEIIEK